MSADYQSIQKENLNNLRFPAEDVLTDKQEIQQRTNNLERAVALGNLEQIKIKIYFEDDSQKYVVYTTIWALTNKNIILKSGVTIPIHRISKIY
jgi:hypothetical protein